MLCRVRAILHPGQNLAYASYAYAGLSMLARAGEIGLELAATGDAPWAGGAHENLVLRLELNGDGRRPRHVCIDFHDRHDTIARESFRWSDVYFKRGFNPDVLARTPPPDDDDANANHNGADRAGWLRKVRPFGLVYLCAERRIRRRLVRHWCARHLRLLARGPRRALSALPRECHALKNFLVSPDVTSFEYGSADQVEPAVLFQTRVWQPGETSDDADAINEERAQTTRALRGALGDAFRGGLVPTPFATEKYADLVTTQHVRRAAYIRFGKRPLVGVYTRGLHDSLAFKLAEYLAAAKCIVMPPPPGTLPEPLEPGRHYLPFHTTDECVSQCQRLLNDPALAMAMRQANAEYYRSSVHPAARMRRCLQAALTEE
jgi:hypothetical protein